MLFLNEMKWDAETEVTINKQGDTFPLKEALTDYFEITLLSKKICTAGSSIHRK